MGEWDELEWLRAIDRHLGSRIFRLHPDERLLAVVCPMKLNVLPLCRGTTLIRVSFGRVLVAAVALTLAGCASTISVTSDPRAAAAAEGYRSYSMPSANPRIAQDAPRYPEAVKSVKTGLAAKGMREATDPQRADLVVSLDYGVGPAQRRQDTILEPVFVTVPGAVETIEVADGMDSKGNPIYRRETRRDPPTTQLTGFRDRPISYVVYEKYARVTARDNKPAASGGPPEVVWTIEATCEGDSRNLRKDLPLMVAAIIETIGTDTRGSKSVRLKDGRLDVAQGQKKR